MMTEVIHTENLTKRFGTFTAVDHISFDVHKGEVFGFLGANGAGKTTAMRMLCGLSKPTSGTGTVAGYDIARQPEMVKKHIGYMSAEVLPLRGYDREGESGAVRRNLRNEPQGDRGED